jgi:hypothetical protein
MEVGIEGFRESRNHYEPGRGAFAASAWRPDRGHGTLLATPVGAEDDRASVSRSRGQ